MKEGTGNISDVIGPKKKKKSLAQMFEQLEKKRDF